jgi:hypothetical protein
LIKECERDFYQHLGVNPMGTILILADVATQAGSPIAAISLPFVIGGGFLAAVGIGSIAWYNSKRPPGWEGKQRPDIVPEVELEENPGLGSPDA